MPDGGPYFILCSGTESVGWGQDSDGWDGWPSGYHGTWLLQYVLDGGSTSIAFAPFDDRIDGGGFCDGHENNGWSKTISEGK